MEPGQVLGGRFKLVEWLGRGGMGEVWAAVDRELGRRVAVKILRGDAGHEQIELLRGEARAAARLHHPGIVALHDLHEHEGRPFLVMELVEGEDLKSVLRASPGGLLPVGRVVALAIEVAEALAFAHEHQVVHRDIKPGNIMVAAGGRVKICDFGIARLMDATTSTADGRFRGTPSYAAPEQIDGRRVDARADLYSLGCTLYKLLTGREPFVGETPGVVCYHHLHTRPTSPRELRAEIPPALDELILRLLDKNPAVRPDATTLRDRLHRLGGTSRRVGDKPRPADTSPATFGFGQPIPVPEPDRVKPRIAVGGLGVWALVTLAAAWHHPVGWLVVLVAGGVSLALLGDTTGNTDREGFGILSTLVVGAGLIVTVLANGVRLLAGRGGWPAFLWSLAVLTGFCVAAFVVLWYADSVRDRKRASRDRAAEEGNRGRYLAVAEVVERRRWFGELEDESLAALVHPLADIPSACFFVLDDERFKIAVVAGAQILLVARASWPPGVYRGSVYEPLRDGLPFPQAKEEITALDNAMWDWVHQVNDCGLTGRSLSPFDVKIVLLVDHPDGDTVVKLTGLRVTCATPGAFDAAARSVLASGSTTEIDLPTVARIYYTTCTPSPAARR